MKQTLMLYVALVLSVMITGCSSKLKNQIGLETSGPNEYSVSKNKPLEMPPHFEVDEVTKTQK